VVVVVLLLLLLLEQELECVPCLALHTSTLSRACVHISPIP